MRVVSEKEGFRDVYLGYRNMILRGKLAPDIHLASILLQHEAPILRKFNFLEVRNPFG